MSIIVSRNLRIIPRVIDELVSRIYVRASDNYGVIYTPVLVDLDCSGSATIAIASAFHEHLVVLGIVEHAFERLSEHGSNTEGSFQ